MKSEPAKHFASLAHTAISMGSNHKSLPLAHLERATFSLPPAVPNHPYISNPHPSPLRKIIFQSVHVVYRPPVRLTLLCRRNTHETKGNLNRPISQPFSGLRKYQIGTVLSRSFVLVLGVEMMPFALFPSGRMSFVRDAV
ncbi:uncharacterized protein EAF01_002390 [Botrytis porri]|uniref:uncharacterized protein n=1 Tax=Botrytis porri TaxID=87229 RepID=UPI0018FF8C83|nr:uncharacterized protein EAF01_002390 [Botrytis porri]KAF7910881.1 hypothetical protein EAF01_002390 [Botrytis porri]